MRFQIFESLVGKSVKIEVNLLQLFEFMVTLSFHKGAVLALLIIVMLNLSQCLLLILIGFFHLMMLIHQSLLGIVL